MVLSVGGSVGLRLPSKKRVKCELEGLCSSSQRSMNELFMAHVEQSLYCSCKSILIAQVTIK